MTMDLGYVSFPWRLIAMLTVAGVIVHDGADRVFCSLAGVRLYDTCCLRLGSPNDRLFMGRYAVALLPFQSVWPPFEVSATIAVLIFAIAANVSSTVVTFLLYWLGISRGVHSLPSSGNAGDL